MLCIELPETMVPHLVQAALAELERTLHARKTDSPKAVASGKLAPRMAAERDAGLRDAHALVKAVDLAMFRASRRTNPGAATCFAVRYRYQEREHKTVYLAASQEEAEAAFVKENPGVEMIPRDRPQMAQMGADVRGAA